MYIFLCEFLKVRSFSVFSIKLTIINHHNPLFVSNMRNIKFFVNIINLTMKLVSDIICKSSVIMLVMLFLMCVTTNVCYMIF